jgi:Cu2+-exporting ATPase
MCLGISPDDAHAALLRGQKEEIVRQLDRQDTLYLGDGANDSLAFNAAWTTGTPVVDRSLLEEKADFYFMGQCLGVLPQLLGLAKRRRRVVQAAFAFALCYNLTAVGICLQGLMSPLLAAILMPLSSAISLAIVGLGFRAQRWRNRNVANPSKATYVRGGGKPLPDANHVPGRTRLRSSSV